VKNETRNPPYNAQRKSSNVFEFTNEKKMERVISVILAVVLAAACGLTAFAPAAQAAVIYVDASAGGSDTGTSCH